ncbi:MAG: 1-deoxy-D-xylulose-5-phosphate synthase N-terminal domain-containing protein [Candidatus Shapirobacteria bacterium]
MQSLRKELRLDLLDLIYHSGGGHLGGSFSSLDLMIAVCFGEIFNLKLDKFILSAGHLAPALYVVLAHAGYFPKEYLSSYASFGSILQGHISTETPGVNYSSGLLGQGLSFSAGLAIGSSNHIICLTTDGEHQEGQVWEAAQFAAKYHLGNLINIVDVNRYQIGGSTDEIMPQGDLAAKYVRFGWTVTEVDGHNFGKITSALKKATHSNYPNCIIAHTVFGSGLSFAKNNHKYHDVKNLSEDLYLCAQRDLNKL